jgi:membrane protease YdiL (CAAX protease family)
MENQISNKSPKRKSPAIFIGLVFLMSSLFWLLGAYTQGRLPEETATGLPISSLMGVSPIIVGLFLVYRESGADGAKALLKRSFDFKRIENGIWYIPVLFLMPVVMVLANLVKDGMPPTVTAPQFPVSMLLVSLLLYFIEALTEEVGWQGYAFEPMQARWNTLTASLILGILWAVWHFIPFVQMGQSAAWIAWQSINLIVTRIIIVWLYNNTGKSVFAAILYHTMNNVSTVMLTSFGLVYDPAIATILLAVIALVVILLWGPKTLASYRLSASNKVAHHSSA